MNCRGGPLCPPGWTGLPLGRFAPPGHAASLPVAAVQDTLFVWSTEFGRTPFTQGIGKPGRDHHQHAFTVFLAGAGLKPGFAFGKSDEIGYKVAEDEVTIYDFHATLLHLLGLEHTKLTFRHAGRDFRLTDVSGEVVRGVLA